MSRYPLGVNEADTITSRTGKKLTDLTREDVRLGHITSDDIKISSEMLRRQGQVALEDDNPQMAANFERAAELVHVPDEVILKMYNKQTKKYMDKLVGGDVDEYLEKHAI